MDKKLLQILGCPIDKEELEFVGGKLICKKCGKKYGVRDGIPVLLVADYSQDNDDLGDK